MKAKIKIIIDAFLHNVMNRRWYSGLCKGKYTSIRFFHTAINMLLLASFFGLAASAVFLLPTLSTFFHLKATLIGRKMHVFFTIWSFILMSVHVGLHWNMVVSAVKKRMKNSKHLYQTIASNLAAFNTLKQVAGVWDEKPT